MYAITSNLGFIEKSTTLHDIPIYGISCIMYHVSCIMYHVNRHLAASSEHIQ